mmetsp:Transcript_10080/g.30803  ORF Transcript_10080/g.30803 Transcript_10080/m.30803 type:complete len:421 (+) Transcript_10080:119-1381(+)
MDQVRDGIVLDQQGRPSGVKSGLSYEFRRFDDVLQGDLDVLREDCREAFTASSVGEDDSYSSGETFLMPAEGMEPRMELERLALQIFNEHVADAVGVDRGESGAEWWTQVIDEEDDIRLHFDRDYALEKMVGINVHPHVATVTYLTDNGGPTLVLAFTPPTVAGEDDCGAGTASEGFISHPRTGSHISFDGRYLHCAYSSMALKENVASSSATGQKRKATNKRITLLVNIWLNYLPVHVSPFPEEKVGAMQTAVGSFRLKPLKFAGERHTVESTKADQEFTFNFVEASRRMGLYLFLSLKALQTDTRNGAAYLLKFLDNSCELRAGEMLSDDDSSDEDDSDDDDAVAAESPVTAPSDANEASESAQDAPQEAARGTVQDTAQNAAQDAAQGAGNTTEGTAAGAPEQSEGVAEQTVPDVSA